MEILFEDKWITVAIKPTDAVSERTDRGDGFADLLAARNPEGYVGVVHRLDRGVGGVMVYARESVAAARLSACVQNHSFQKEYLALAHGLPMPESGRLCDLLFHDRMRNKTFVVDRQRRGVKEAILDYEVLRQYENAQYGAYSLVKICLLTGRTHQIRVQFSHRGHPLLGDRKYGATDRCPIGLFCHRLSFPHPITGEQMTFEKEWERMEQAE